jgi:hypothetical protein
MTIVGPDHVGVALPPGCERDARRFYGGLLGLEELEKPEPLASRGGAWFALGAGGHQLHVGVEQDFAPARKAHPALAVALGGLEVLADRLVAGGPQHRREAGSEVSGENGSSICSPMRSKLHVRHANAPTMPARPGPELPSPSSPHTSRRRRAPERNATYRRSRRIHPMKSRYHSPDRFGDRCWVR